uniref:Protein pelota homolog n=1 Tax=Trieres chinensis TaxID=1514140 RepID=A0A7S1Z461_TRICV|mmetsp:Transcript_17110/g.35124  ORF Transcript_17110/g.35124 Transcript_17110/m.35124 type:complete len:422 (+) Transcript_17110:323-1588(+)
MKLLKKNISAKDGSGTVQLRPETPEDLWHSYNLLRTGDLVRCTTLRKVMKESSTGSTKSNTVRTNLTVEVTKVDFDPDSMQVRLSGKNCEESDHVRMGAHHTLTLELGRNFSVEKTCWDRIYLDLIQEACNPELGAEVAALVMQTGLAHLCLVAGSVTVTKARVETNIPKKRAGSSAHSKSITKFYEAVYQAVLRHVDFEQVKCVLIASPGYVKDDFFKYLTAECVRRDDRPFVENRSKFVLCKASSGHKHALEEVFADSDVIGRLEDTKFAREVRVLNKFMRMIDTDPDRAYYGYAHVHRADTELAVESLLVTDALFRSSDVVTRKKYVQLVESVRDNGGEVLIFSSLHVSGQQLQQVSGVAAILRYPLPDLDELEEEAARAEEEAREREEAALLEAEEEDENDEEARVREDMEDMGLSL